MDGLRFYTEVLLMSTSCCLLEWMLQSSVERLLFKGNVNNLLIMLSAGYGLTCWLGEFEFSISKKVGHITAYSNAFKWPF